MSTDDVSRHTQLMCVVGPACPSCFSCQQHMCTHSNKSWEQTLSELCVTLCVLCGAVSRRLVCAECTAVLLLCSFVLLIDQRQESMRCCLLALCAVLCYSVMALLQRAAEAYRACVSREGTPSYRERQRQLQQQRRLQKAQDILMLYVCWFVCVLGQLRYSHSLVSADAGY